MKPIIMRLYGTALFIFFPILFFLRKKIKGRIIIILMTVVILSGCFQHYFRTHTQTKADEATIQQLMSINKYFIIHLKNRVAGVENLTVSNDKIEANLISLPPEHLKYLDPETNRTNRVKLKDKTTTLLEVHLYTSTEIDAGQNHLSLPLSSFDRIDIYEFDKKATTANHVLSIVGIAAVVTSAVALIAFAIACNCPQVCVNNNGTYQFVSGVYSGAVYSSLERTDYLPLYNLQAVNNSFDIKIKNVNEEEQFINRMQLLRVNHPADVNILVDRHGNILSYDKLQIPVSATINRKADITKQLSLADDDQYLFDGEKGENGFSDVSLTFNKPPGAQKAKLIIHGGNSLWSGYLYHSFAELFGTGYEKWRNEKDKSEPKEMEQWQTDQALPLMVYIEKNGKWELADYFAHTGNTASRDMIMELDISGIKTEQIKIKLETVYQFWNLDYAAIDFSENKKMNTVLIDPLKAVKGDGSSQIESVNSVDQHYCHLVSNEEMNLEYSPSSSKDGVNSYFFVSTGYYHNIKRYEGKPQIATLMKFKNKGAFDKFSRQKFEEIQNTLIGVSSK
jgi:hypothetical protein